MPRADACAVASISMLGDSDSAVTGAPSRMTCCRYVVSIHLLVLRGLLWMDRACPCCWERPSMDGFWRKMRPWA
jgi:hypothetical protein